ncbi:MULTISPECIES: photosynthetic complex assembly protein PuhC [unclassified Yoonia]|uniref:photosynthetic complex assembly protein PuhC n=1 Tax=unclassified Yoonia TaxID=2629118 RepID=UPI002AFF6AA5|nr:MULTISPECIES: photosynthetic complex assembly protein PuhC [unclassified Yoonia]
MVDAPTTMKHPEKLLVPPFVARAMFALMFLVVALVAFAKVTDRPVIAAVEQTPIAQSIDVIITGDKTGIYTVTSPDGTHLASSSDDMAGFLGVMGRVIDRERTVQGVPLDGPLQVVRRENGNIAILDASTGMATELIGYGRDNVAAFAKLLD